MCVCAVSATWIDIRSQTLGEQTAVDWTAIEYALPSVCQSLCECLWCVCVCTLPLITQYSTARRENNALVRLDGRTRLIR